MLVNFILAHTQADRNIFYACSSGKKLFNTLILLKEIAEWFSMHYVTTAWGVQEPFFHQCISLIHKYIVQSEFSCLSHNTHFAACFFYFLVGFLLCHSSLNTNQASQELWKMALRSGFYLTLTRDELLNIHKVTEDLFDNIKGYERRSEHSRCSIRKQRLQMHMPWKNIQSQTVLEIKGHRYLWSQGRLIVLRPRSKNSHRTHITLD